MPDSFEPRRQIARNLLCLVLPFVVSACGPGPAQPEIELFTEASLALEDESYSSAISSYKKLLEEYPFSDKAEIASVNIAYAHYLNEEYPEAIAAFNDFERLYPVSPLLPFVSYTIGLCWLDQAKDASRDATASDEALRQFRKVAAEYPRTIYGDLARFRQQQARENLSDHEILVGDYYRQRKHYEAAASRYRHVVSVYPSTENARRAAERLKSVEIDVMEETEEKAGEAKADAGKKGDKKPDESAKAEPPAPPPTPSAPTPVNEPATSGDASPASGTPEKPPVF